MIKLGTKQIKLEDLLRKVDKLKEKAASKQIYQKAINIIYNLGSQEVFHKLRVYHTSNFTLVACTYTTIGDMVVVFDSKDNHVLFEAGGPNKSDINLYISGDWESELDGLYKKAKHHKNGQNILGSDYDEKGLLEKRFGLT